MTEALPWVKWHFDKWRGDPGLRKCSLAARGLWMELLCVMHEATPYGHLAINMKPLCERDVMQFVGSSSIKEVKKLLSELRDAHVFSETSDGIIYCRRLVRDHDLREKSKAYGKNGGNPALKKTSERVNPVLNEGVGVPLNPDKDKEREKEGEKEKKEKKEPSLRSGGSRGTRLPDDWTPGDAGWKFASELGLSPKAVFAVFRDYWLARAGSAALKVDWQATWQNWCRKEAERIGARPPQAPDLLNQSRPTFLPTVANGL